MTPGHSRQVARTAGYTLFELLLVLAILSMVATLGWPAFRRSLAKAHLRDAARQLRTDLARARVEAIRTGTAQKFRYQMGGTAYEISPLWSTDDPGTSLDHDTEDGLASGTWNTVTATQPFETDPGLAATDLVAPEPPENIRELPEGTWFDDPTATDGIADSLSLQVQASAQTVPPEVSDAASADDSSTAAVPGSIEEDTLEAYEWSAPVIFFPNGRTTNVRVRLLGLPKYQVDLTLRGLTGSIRIGDLLRWEIEP